MHPAKVDARSYTAPAMTVVIVIGLLATITASYWEHQQTLRDARKQFEQAADRVTLITSRRMGDFSHILRGTRGLFLGSSSVTSADFRAYAESRDVCSEHHGALGVGFIEKVPRSGLQSFVTATRADESPTFTVNTSGDQDDLFVIKYIEPLEPNLPSWGYDIGQEPRRREAAERAMPA